MGVGERIMTRSPSRAGRLRGSGPGAVRRASECVSRGGRPLKEGRGSFPTGRCWSPRSPCSFRLCSLTRRPGSIGAAVLGFSRVNMQCPPHPHHRHQARASSSGWFGGLTSPGPSHTGAFTETPSTWRGPRSAQGGGDELHSGPCSQSLAGGCTITHPGKGPGCWCWIMGAEGV